MSRSFSSFIFVLLIFILLTGCYPEPQVRPTDMDQIKIELIEKSEMPNGIAYTLKLKNLSKFTIAQNNVYISYPIKTSTGSRSNQYKIEAKNNRLQIEPNEEVTLNVLAPIEGFGENQTLDTENFNVEIVGYIGEVKETRRFQKIGGLEFFK
jgi:hypothetical protein